MSDAPSWRPGFKIQRVHVWDTQPPSHFKWRGWQGWPGVKKPRNDCHFHPQTRPLTSQTCPTSTKPFLPVPFILHQFWHFFLPIWEVITQLSPSCSRLKTMVDAHMQHFLQAASVESYKGWGGPAPGPPSRTIQYVAAFGRPNQVELFLPKIVKNGEKWIVETRGEKGFPRRCFFEGTNDIFFPTFDPTPRPPSATPPATPIPHLKWQVPECFKIGGIGIENHVLGVGTCAGIRKA
jgi:hypothetical protein